MNSKTYLNSIIVIAVVLVLIAIFGASNHFMGYYDPKGEIAKKNSNSNNNNPKPTPTPDPKPEPTPAPADKEIKGYKCKYANCQILNGTSLINNKYLFIVDGEENVVLFDVTIKEVKETYKSVIVSGNSYIAKNSEDKYGIISVGNDVSSVVPFEYTYIAYVTKKDNYILTKNSSSFVANSTGHPITLTYNAQIIDYNDLYIITKTTNGEYHIFNFNNRTELTEYVNSKRIFIELVGKYVGVVTADYTYRLFDFQSGNKILAECQLDTSATKFHAIINNSNKLEVYANDTLVKTIDL